MVFLRIRGTVEQGLGNLFVASSSSHFFNKTDFEQYLFEMTVTSPYDWDFCDA